MKLAAQFRKRLERKEFDGWRDEPGFAVKAWIFATIWLLFGIVIFTIVSPDYDVSPALIAAFTAVVVYLPPKMAEQAREGHGAGHPEDRDAKYGPMG